MKSILGIGNALTDILAVLPDDEFLSKYHLPKGSMQHVDMATGDKIWSSLKEIGVNYVPGGSAANTITCTSIFGMPSGYIGKIGNDELGHLFKSTMEQYGVKANLLYGTKSSGRCMVFITGANAERTFASYMGSALEMGPADLKPEYFRGWDYFHIEGYLVQNQDLILKAVQMAREAGCIISIDMASYNVVESNEAFLHNLVDDYVDIVFANEEEATAFSGKTDPNISLQHLGELTDIAVVKVGKRGAQAQQNFSDHSIYTFAPGLVRKAVDTTAAGDFFAAGFLHGLIHGENLRTCLHFGNCTAAEVIQVMGTQVSAERLRASLNSND
jgi:sugar/nucleoside kinase (ribokinase family)